MPYKDPRSTRALESRRASTNRYRERHLDLVNRRKLERLQARRLAWFQKAGPCRVCGSWSSLEVDHINPETKANHDVTRLMWFWPEVKLQEELKKCQPLCSNCHNAKSLWERRTFTPEQILWIREAVRHGMSQTAVARIVGGCSRNIGHIIRFETYKEIR